LNENHPVLIALEAELAALLEQYRHKPDEQSRYRVVKLERLIGEWAPSRLPVA
jgi:hypothetical protein